MIFLFEVVLFILLSAPSSARELRPVFLEWEAVEDASKYELEIVSSDGKAQKFTTKSPQFDYELNVGVYKMRIRAFDDRNVPGAWSPLSDFNVSLSEFRKQPEKDAQIIVESIKEGLVRFEWQTISGVTNYKFYLRRGEREESFVVADTKFEKILPLGGDFQWSVAPMFFDGSESERREFWSFQILGKALQAPKINAPMDAFVKSVSWVLPKDAQWGDVVLSLQDPVSKVWRNYVEYESASAQKIEILPHFPGGNYALTVKAGAPFRLPSEATQLTFEISAGDRSPASQRVQEMRDSLQKKSPYIFQASWLYSDLRYQSQNYEYLSRSQFSAQGGSGRLGAGYLSVDGNWGGAYYADLSGFNIGSDNYRFFAQELHVIYRYWRDTAMVRWSFGYYQKQMPELIATASANSYRVQTIDFNGPHFGVDYWRPVTRRWGYKLQARLYDLSIDTTTPNGKNLVSRFSYNVGVLGSMRLNNEWVGFLGYTHKVDQVAYQADVNATGFASKGDVNDVQINGNFLNLMLEWNF
jgi:hypothetical protein